MLYQFTTILCLFFSVCNPASAENSKSVLLLKIHHHESLGSIQASVVKGQNTTTLQCADSPDFAWDGETDDIWTCLFEGPINSPERIRIQSPMLSYPLFDGLLTLPNTKQVTLTFQTRKIGSQWKADRIALHSPNQVNGVMVSSREWLIAIWAIIVLNILGLIIWFNQRRRS